LQENSSDVASVGTDEASSADDNESFDNDEIEDSEPDNDSDDDEQYVDAGDEVQDIMDQAPWVTERRHSGDGEVCSAFFEMRVAASSTEPGCKAMPTV